MLVVVLLIGLAIFGWYIGGYNKVVNFEQAVEKAWADIDAALQRRLDLVPNLVTTVKGYAEHEKELFESIAKSRERYFAAGNREGKIEASNELSGFLSRLLMLQENYPNLRASENFLSLQDQLEGTENRIAVARTRYNEAVRDLNTFARSFFGRFFVRQAGVEEAEYFEAPAEAAETVPRVDFAD